MEYSYGIKKKYIKDELDRDLGHYGENAVYFIKIIIFYKNHYFL